jgi:flavorubredoxin
MNITKTIKNVGINDNSVRIFESQYHVQNGMTYNSYLIDDEKVTILDTIDIKEQDKWMKNIEDYLKGQEPYYLIISHLEPDHSGSIQNFIKKYPNITLVGNKKTFEMLPQFIKIPNTIKMLEVKEGETLNIGKHQLEFYMAPMVHWPEVMVTYEHTEKILFSADAFGKFGAVKDEDYINKNKEKNWEEEARRYYFGIVGKYGMQVQSLLKKLQNKEIKTICPLHGPIITENLEFYLNKYMQWSSYTAERDEILILCASIYGHTLESAKLLKNIITKKEVQLLDLTKCDMYEAVAKAFEYKTIVLAASSYNMNVFPPMEELLNKLKDRNYQNRTIAIIENGSWAPSAARVMKEIISKMKDIEIIEPTITIKTSLSEENKKQIKILGEKIEE